MRRTLGTLALALTLAGCGDDSGVSRDVDQPADEVVLVSQTAGGGSPATEATDVTGADALTSYVAQFDDTLAAKVTEAVTGMDSDVVLAQVVAVGCDIPPSAVLEGDVIVPAKVSEPMRECFAPVTTVAVAAAG